MATCLGDEHAGFHLSVELGNPVSFKVYFDLCCLGSMSDALFLYGARTILSLDVTTAQLCLPSQWPPHTHGAWRNAHQLGKVRSGALVGIFWVSLCLADVLRWGLCSPGWPYTCFVPESALERPVLLPYIRRARIIDRSSHPDRFSGFDARQLCKLLLLDETW